MVLFLTKKRKRNSPYKRDAEKGMIASMTRDISKMSVSNKKTNDIDLYMIPPSSPCRAVIMTCKTINLPYNMKIVDLMQGDQLKPEFAKMNPLRTIPTVDDNGLYLYESRSIMRYLVEKYAPGHELYPNDVEARAKIDQMLEFDLGTLYIAFRNYFVPWFLSGIQPTPERENNFVTALKQLEELMSKSTYAAGNRLTLADLSIFAELTFTELNNYDYKNYPHIQKWMDRLKKELPYHNEVNVEAMEGFRGFVLRNVNKK